MSECVRSDAELFDAGCAHAEQVLLLSARHGMPLVASQGRERMSAMAYDVSRPLLESLGKLLGFTVFCLRVLHYEHGQDDIITIGAVVVPTHAPAHLPVVEVMRPIVATWVCKGEPS